jgi:hypothetical protein
MMIAVCDRDMAPAILVPEAMLKTLDTAAEDRHMSLEEPTCRGS